MTSNNDKDGHVQRLCPLLNRSKPVSSPVNSRSRVRRKDLVGQLAPFRVVDAIDPALRLDNQTAVLVDVLCTLAVVPLLLRRLNGNCSILAGTGIDLDSLLVARDLQGDPGGAGVCAEDGDQRVLCCIGSRTVDDEAGIVASAASSTDAICILEVLAHQLSAGEIEAAIASAGDVQDSAVGDEDTVCADIALGQGKLEERVVQDGLVLERVQVPVDVVGQHDGCLVRQGQRRKSRRQLRETFRILSRATGFHAERSMGDDVSRETLKRMIQQTEGNSRL